VAVILNIGESLLKGTFAVKYFYIIIM